MQKDKKNQDKRETPNDPIKGVSCFSILSKYEVDCQRKKCPNWISHPDGHNCVMIAASNGPHTLQEIGKIYDLTRMRICQIEKGIYEKIRNSCS